MASQERRICSSRWIYPDPAGTSVIFVPPDISRSDPAGTSDIFVPPDISKSGGYNLSAGYIRTRNLYFPPFRLSSCHVRPISSIRQISGFPPDASRLVFCPIKIVPHQIFSRQIWLALRRRVDIIHVPPLLIKVPPCILVPNTNCAHINLESLVCV